MPAQRGFTIRKGESVMTTGISFPDAQMQSSIRCSVYGCLAEFSQERKDCHCLIRDYLAAGWSYHYTPRGIRPVCQAHRILIEQSDAAL